MRALSLEAIGDLQFKDVPIPRLEKDEVLLKVGSCGICQSDVPRVYVKGTYHFPTVVGHEFAGEVAEVGDANDERLISKRFVVFPLLPCFHCPSCLRGDYATCESYDYYGSRRDGGMEEYIAIKKWNLVPIPQDLSFTLAALTEPTAVSIHAANKIGKCRTVGVFGSGTIGTVVGLVLKERGYDVTILGRNESSLEYLKDFGIETVHLSKAQQYDATIETANAATFVNCLKHTKPGGTVVCMGNPMTGVPLAQDDYWIIMRRELKIIGTWNSSFNDETNDWIEAISFLNRVKPQRLVTHEFELKDAVKAFETARDRKDITLKVIVNVSL